MDTTSPAPAVDVSPPVVPAPAGGERHAATGLYLDGTTMLEWNHADDGLLVDAGKVQQEWWSALFEHFTNSDLALGNFLWLSHTPTVIAERLRPQSWNNKGLGRAPLEDLRYLADRRVYVSRTLSFPEEGVWKSFEMPNPRTITLAAREGFRQHVKVRCEVSEDIFAHAIMAALDEWSEELDPQDTFLPYWRRHDPSQERKAQSVNDTSSSADDHSSLGGSGLMAQAARLPTGLSSASSHTSLDSGPEERIKYLEDEIQRLKRTMAETQPTGAAAPEAELSSRQKLRLQYLHDREGEDLSSSGLSIPSVAQQLLRNPPLECCTQCGILPQAGSCGCSRSESAPSDKYAQLFPVSAHSVAAQQVSPAVACNYTHCYGLKNHALAACPALHQRCETCRCRGHSASICPLGDRPTLTFDRLSADFEAFADSGYLTRLRNRGAPGMGFYPARSLRCIRYLRATGYTALRRLPIGKAMDFMENIFQLTQAEGMEGLGPQFTPLEDREVRALVRKSSESEPTPPKRAKPGPLRGYAQVAAKAATASSRSMPPPPSRSTPLPPTRSSPSSSGTEGKSPRTFKPYRPSYSKADYQKWNDQHDRHQGERNASRRDGSTSSGSGSKHQRRPRGSKESRTSASTPTAAPAAAASAATPSPAASAPASSAEPSVSDRTGTLRAASAAILHMTEGLDGSLYVKRMRDAAKGNPQP